MEWKELAEIAVWEMRKHGLLGWTFALARTKSRLGVCKYRTKRIEISEFHVLNNPPEVVLDTLLHEIAHAIAGPAAGHGPAWKAVASRLGATPRACDSSHETIVTPGDWQATCPSCSKTFHRYRRPLNLTGYRCRCKDRGSLIFEYKGDPALRPVVPLTAEESAKWEAKCSGCQTLHLRSRRPRPGVWTCGCRHRGELAWKPRAQAGTRD